MESNDEPASARIWLEKNDPINGTRNWGATMRERFGSINRQKFPTGLLMRHPGQCFTVRRGKKREILNAGICFIRHRSKNSLLRVVQCNNGEEIDFGVYPGIHGRYAKSHFSRKLIFTMHRANLRNKVEFMKCCIEAPRGAEY